MSDFITKPAFFASFAIQLRTALLAQGKTDPDLQDDVDWFEANHLVAVYGDKALEDPEAMLDSMAEGSPKRPWAYYEGGGVSDAVDRILEEGADPDDCRGVVLDLWSESKAKGELSFTPRERSERSGRRNRFANRSAKRS